MHWFIDPIRNHYADFEGRVTREPFWLFVLISWVISFALGMISEMISGLYSLAVLVPSLAITARRLHDTGRSGWWQLLWFIPIIGWIILIVYLAQDTTPSDNMYGKNPKAVAPATTATPESPQA